MNKVKRRNFPVFADEVETEITIGQNLTSFVNCSKPCQVVQYIREESIVGKSAKISMTSVKQFMSYYRILPSYASRFYRSITITIEEKYTNCLHFDEVKMAILIWKKLLVPVMFGQYLGVTLDNHLSF